MTIENTCQLRSKTENRTEIYPKQENTKEKDPSHKHQKIAHLLYFGINIRSSLVPMLYCSRAWYSKTALNSK